MCAESVHEAWGREELEPRLAKEVFEMKTPEEIKAIKLALMDIETTCGHCPYEGEPNGCNRPGGTCKMFDVALDAAEAIQQLEAQQPRWISVGERLPEDAERVYVALRGGAGGVYIAQYFKNKCQPQEDFWMLENDWEVPASPTHWMPLPPGPEVEKE